MAFELLRTDYVDATFEGLRRYLMSENGDGSVSFHDITKYTVKEGSFFGAKDANKINTAVNAILAALENGTDLYEVFTQFFDLQKTLFLEESDAKQEGFEEYITQLRSYMDSKWDELKTEYTGDIQYFKDVQENAFNVWFQMVRDQLTNDVAGHLQTQIGNLDELNTESKDSLTDAVNDVVNSVNDNAENFSSFLQNLRKTGIFDPLLNHASISANFTFADLMAKDEVTFFTNWSDKDNFPAQYGSGVCIPAKERRYRFLLYMVAHKTDVYCGHYNDDSKAIAWENVNEGLLVNGVVPVAKGGTGKTTAKDAANDFLNSLDTGNTNPVDSDVYPLQWMEGNVRKFRLRPLSTLWNWIKPKVDSLLTAKVSKSGDTMTGTLNSSKTTGSYLAGNQGQAIINSTATGAYTMLDKLNSTNGYFTDGVHSGSRVFQYTPKTTVSAGTNAVAKTAILLNEDGDTIFPGDVSVGKDIHVNKVLAKGAFDGAGDEITTHLRDYPYSIYKLKGLYKVAFSGYLGDMWGSLENLGDSFSISNGESIALSIRYGGGSMMVTVQWLLFLRSKTISTGKHYGSTMRLLSTQELQWSDNGEAISSGNVAIVNLGASTNLGCTITAGVEKVVIKADAGRYVSGAIVPLQSGS